MRQSATVSGSMSKLKTRGKLRRTQHAQTVFRKRFAETARKTAARCLVAIKRIDQFTGEWILKNRVDGEVAPARCLVNAHRRIALDHKRLVTASRFTLTARDGNVEMMPELVNGERFADDVDWTKLVQDLAQTFRRRG